MVVRWLIKDNKMVKRIGGTRRKTRQILKKSRRTKGKMSITSYLREFAAGDRVVLKAEPSHVGSGMYHPMFHGRIGTITGKKGSCYAVEIKDGSVRKELVVHPVHLKKIRQ